MTPLVAIAPLNAEPPPAPRQAAWTWPLSVVIHALLLAAAVAWWTVRPIVVPPVTSIDVQVLSPREFQDATQPKPTVPQAPPSVPSPTPALPSVPLPTRLPPTPPPSTPSTAPPAPVTTGTEPGMVHASHLYSTSLLREPASLEVRNTLPTLAPYERLTQLCNIEATEQIRRALKDSNPETVSASAFAETNLVNGVLKAPGAAYRSHAKWFALSFDCTVRSDLLGVADFSFKLGPPIPKDQWDAHDLIGIDEDDEELGSVPP